MGTDEDQGYLPPVLPTYHMGFVTCHTFVYFLQYKAMPSAFRIKWACKSNISPWDPKTK